MDKYKIIGVILNTNDRGKGGGERGKGGKSIPPELSFEIGIGIEKQNPAACGHAAGFRVDRFVLDGVGSKTMRFLRQHILSGMHRMC